MNSEYQTPLSRPSNEGVLEAMPLLELCLSSRFLKEFMALHWQRIFERIERTNEPPQKNRTVFLSSLYILPDPLGSIIGRCTLYTPGCRMKAYE